jgi:hypothetical protein
MRFAALDIGKRTGVSVGDAGSMPLKVFAVDLLNGERSKFERMIRLDQMPRDEFLQRGVGGMGRFLDWLRLTYQVEAIVAEHYMSPAGMRSADAGEWQLLLHGAVKGFCGLHGIRTYLPHASTITKHFLGSLPAKSRGPKTSRQKKEMRDAKKAAYVKRAQLLGYMPKDVYDEDKADSAALYDLASASIFHSPISNFQMFGAAQ